MKFDIGPNLPGDGCRDEKSLRDIEEALERLDNGEFGYCRSCGAPISVQRLCNDPTVKVCSTCAISGSVRQSDEA
ncbi:MAG: TraR/DksA C4-type zinc finger protein [Pseudomonadota bacterium]